MTFEEYKLKLQQSIDICIFELNKIKSELTKENIPYHIANVELLIKHFPGIKRGLIYFNNVEEAKKEVKDKLC